MSINYNEKELLEKLNEEEYINMLMLNFDFQKPLSFFDFFIKENFKDNKELYKCNIYQRNPDKIFLEKYQRLCENFDSLNEENIDYYMKLFDKENILFYKKLSIIKKYIFKSINGNIKVKKTAFQIYLNEELINGIDHGFNFTQIIDDALLKWENLNLLDKVKYLLNHAHTKHFFDIIEFHSKINSFLVFIYHYFMKNIVSKENYPSLKILINLFDDLPKKIKILYEEISSELIYLKFKFHDIYNSAHGIDLRTPSGALKLFLQKKVDDNEIQSIKEGKELYNKLSDDEKEVYLIKSHYEVLGYIYKQLLKKKKIKAILPPKPIKPFNIYMATNPKNKIPYGYNTFEYYHKKYNELTQFQKDIYINEYQAQLNNYNNICNDLQNKIFDLPKKPRSSFSFFVTERIKQFYEDKTKIYIYYL